MCRLVISGSRENDREGRAEDEGKIEGRGTRRGFRPGLHVGWRGTRLKGSSASLWRKLFVTVRFSRAPPHRLRWNAHHGRA